MKRVLTALLITVFLFALSGCSSQPEQKKDGTVQAGLETVAPTTTSSAESPDVTPEASAEPELPPVQAIVFDAAVDDPLTVSTPYTGTAALKLTLFETSPGIFAGEGTLTRQLVLQSEANNISTDTVCRLIFTGAVPGEASSFVSLNSNIIDQSSAWGGTTELGAYKTHLLITRQRPIDYQLITDGDTAQLYIKLEKYEFVFSGDCMTLSPAVPKPGLDQLAGKCISINSTFYETGNDYNDEYRAMLTATQTSDFEYAGELCVYGTGYDIPFVDEAVSFKLESFDEKAYKSLGGELLGRFDAFGVIHASAGDYIVLLDGDKPLIEPKSTGIAFYGNLLSADQAGEAQHIANESKKLMRTLYDGCEKNKQDTASSFQGKPAWYPDWLMPKPMKSTSNWWGPVYANELGYNIFMVNYSEPDADLDYMLEHYEGQLSGYENFEAFIPDDSVDAVFYFTQGVYSIRIVLTRTPNQIAVSIM